MVNAQGVAVANLICIYIYNINVYNIHIISYIYIHKYAQTTLKEFPKNDG